MGRPDVTTASVVEDPPVLPTIRVPVGTDPPDVTTASHPLTIGFVPVMTAAAVTTAPGAETPGVDPTTTAAASTAASGADVPPVVPVIDVPVPGAPTLIRTGPGRGGTVILGTRA
jgi:hypothetical protein